MATSHSIVGTCPKCSKPVRANEPDGPVWTCPFNLSEQNPYWQPLPDGYEYSEADMAKAGLYSLCVEDWEGWCPADHMPLHSKCYDKGGY